MVPEWKPTVKEADGLGGSRQVEIDCQARPLLVALFQRVPDDQFVEFRPMDRQGNLMRRRWARVIDGKISSWRDDLPICLDGEANIYFGICPRVRQGGTKEDVDTAVAVWFDEITKAPPDLPPFSWLIETSPGKAQGGYFLDEPTTDLDRVEALNRRLAYALGGDNVADRARILRLPGFLNVKYPGGVRARQDGVHGDRRYTLDELDRALPQLPQEPEQVQGQPQGRTYSGKFDPHWGARLSREEQQQVAAFLTGLGLKRGPDGRYVGACPFHPCNCGPGHGEVGAFYCSPQTGTWACFCTHHPRKPGDKKPCVSGGPQAFRQFGVAVGGCYRNDTVPTPKTARRQGLSFANLLGRYLAPGGGKDRLLEALKHLNDAEGYDHVAACFEAHVRFDCPTDDVSYARRYHCQQPGCAICAVTRIRLFLEEHGGQLSALCNPKLLQVGLPPMAAGGPEEVKNCYAEIRKAINRLGKLLPDCLYGFRSVLKNGQLTVEIVLFVDYEGGLIPKLAEHFGAEYVEEPVYEGWIDAQEKFALLMAVNFSWGVPEDYEIWRLATKGLRLLQGKGALYRVSGGGKLPKGSPRKCAVCGKHNEIRRPGYLPKNARMVQEISSTTGETYLRLLDITPGGGGADPPPDRSRYFAGVPR